MAEQYLTSDAVGLLEKKLKDAKAADLPYHYRGRLTVASAVLETSGELPKVEENLFQPSRGLLSSSIQRWKVNRLQKESRRKAEEKLEQIELQIRHSFQKEQEEKRQKETNKGAIAEGLRRHVKAREELFRCAKMFQDVKRQLEELGLRAELEKQAQARLEALFEYHLNLLP